MTDNTQGLDEILNTYAKAYYEAKHESEFNTCDWAMDKAKQDLTDWHNKQIEAVLDSKAFYDPSGTSPLINPREIQAESNKLKERDDETK